MGGGTDTNRTRRKCVQLSDTMGEFLIPSVKSCTADAAAPPSRRQCQVCVRLVCPKKSFRKEEKKNTQRNTPIGRRPSSTTLTVENYVPFSLFGLLFLFFSRRAWSA